MDLSTLDLPQSERITTLKKIEQRVLWLAIQQVHYANRHRPKKDKLKVGGHQTSSASVVTILTTLYFNYLRHGDLISIKPHASPVFHAIQYLLGKLDQSRLKQLRDFHGLQAYPSRTKDPDRVDFSTGSVGMGVGMTTFASLTQDYLRFKSLIPDSEPPGRTSCAHAVTTRSGCGTCSSISIQVTPSNRAACVCANSSAVPCW